jgi:hypothetical protein
METNHVVKSGMSWPFSEQPNCKRMIGQLERNEALVSWVQPNSGDVQNQFPAIRVKDHYYTMSLRMMKGKNEKSCVPEQGTSPPGTALVFTKIYFIFSGLASRAPEEELRQPRNNPACRREATDPRGAAGGEDAHAAAIQCE